MKKKNKKAKLETMCDLAGRKAELRELKAAARGARHICAECGRSAGRVERLCRPKAM